MAYQRNGYWYRSKRNGDHVETEYLGAGELGRAIAELDALDREQRQMERAELRAEQERERKVDRTLDATGDLLRLLVQAHLLVNGYHNHKGQWRKRRDDTTNRS